MAGHAQLGRARGEALQLVPVVEQRRPAGDQEHRIALGEQVAQRREALQQAERALARLDPADGEHGEPLAEPGQPARRAALRVVARGPEPPRVDPVVHEPGGDAELGGEPLDPRARHAQDAVGGDDRPVLARDQRRRREVVHVVHGPDHAADHALVAERERRVRRQAVLGVHDVVRAGRQDRAQAVGVGVEHRLDALVERRVDRHVADDAQRQRGRPEQRLAGARERRQLDAMPAPGEGLGRPRARGPRRRAA